MPRVVVLGDSLTFHGPEGPVPLADERLYPNVLARRLQARAGGDWQVQVWARAGWGVRELWLGLQKDVHLQQQLLLGADAVVVGLGSVDALSVGVPRWVTMALPYLRPTPLRRAVRRGIDRVHARLVRATGGAWAFTPRNVVRHCWGKSIDGIRLFAPDAALCAVLPARHRAVYYGGLAPHHPAVHTLLRAMAAARDVAVVDLAALSARHLGALNRDGAHWGWALHAEVADAIAEALLPQLAHRAAGPPSGAATVPRQRRVPRGPE